MKIRFCFSVFGILATTLVLRSVVTAEESHVGISASWKLLENQPQGRFVAELTLHNNGNHVAGRRLVAIFQFGCEAAARLDTRRFQVDARQWRFLSPKASPQCQAAGTR